MRHPWKARLLVAIIMLILPFVGLIITYAHRDGGWLYWRIMVPVFALLCLSLSFYLRRKWAEVIGPVSLRHELLHWAGLGGAVYVINVFVNLGIFGRFEAGLLVLTLLAFATFLAGVYVENTLLVIGVLLGGFAIAAALVEVYLYIVLIPAAVIALLILYFISRLRRHSAPPRP